MADNQQEKEEKLKSMSDAVAERPENVPAQGFLFPLAVVFVLGFEAVFAFGPGPLLSHCFKYSISSSVKSNIALTPIYRFGWYPCLFNLCLVASDEIPPSPFFFSKRFAISSIVYSIPSSIYEENAPDQGENVKKSDIRSILLYGCIVKTRKILKISVPTLDYPLGRVYSVSMSDIRTNKKRLPEAPEAERHPIGAKGEFYERRTEKFSGMA